jgi:hypothetical protein
MRAVFLNEDKHSFLHGGGDSIRSFRLALKKEGE